MESENDLYENNLRTLKEMLLDEDRIITYISLSKDLCLHVNSSKLLLHQFLQNMRKENTNLELTVNYIISGLSDKNEAKTMVCLESELPAVRSTLKNLYFQHIYSISKSSTANSHANLLLVHNFKDFNLCAGSIKNSNCSKLTSDQINNLKSKSLNIPPTSLHKPVEISKKKITIENNKADELKNENHKDKTAHTNDIKSESRNKKEDCSPVKEINKKQGSQKVNGHKAQKSIQGFFNKNTTLSKKNIFVDISTKSETKVKEDIKIENLEVDPISSDSKKNKEASNEITEKPNKIDDIQEKAKSIKNGGNNMLNKIQKSSKVDKKRKRVLHISDSESDSEDENKEEKTDQKMCEDSDDEIPPTPMTNNIKITTGIVNPRKKRKIIDKTYTDGEGYILTKKVEVYESYSEDENVVENIIKEVNVKEVKTEVSPKIKKEPKNKKKKNSSPQKGKQATLTSFFKRK